MSHPLKALALSSDQMIYITNFPSVSGEPEHSIFLSYYYYYNNIKLLQAKPGRHKVTKHSLIT